MKLNSKKVVEKDLEYICSNLKDELTQMSGKNLLITGGAGFLGYYLVQTILYWNKGLEDGQMIRLTVYDNYIRGVPSWLSSPENHGNLSLLKHDMREPLPKDILDFQYIIHAAGIASPIYYRKHPIETMDANINGLRSLLDYCRLQSAKGKPIEGFLFYSSSEIYGDPIDGNIPTAETYRGNVSCTGPRACYDESKRYGETLCVNFARQYNLPIKIARPFNNYGPGLKITDGRVIPDFAHNILSGRNIIMLSDGTPMRTFCYVADAIVGYYKVLVKGRTGESYNIGVESPEISIADLAEQIVNIAKELFSYQGMVIHQISPDKEYLIDNPSRRCPSIIKARAELNYNPQIHLDDGLRRSLLWYYDNNDAEEA